jgi:gliding motility-associated-like protein
MDELNNIGQLFRDKLKGHTIEPSDKVWANIQKSIGSSPAIQPKAKFAKYIISGAAVVALVVASIAVAYFVKSDQKDIASNPQVKLQTTTNNPAQTANQETVTNANSTNYNPMTIGYTRPVVVSDPIQLNNNQPTMNPLIENKVVNTQTNQTNPISFVDNSQPKLNTTQPNNITPVMKTIDLSDEHPKTNITLEISRDTTVCIGEPFTLKVKGGNSIVWSTGSNSEEIAVSALNEEQIYIYRAFVRTLNGDTSIVIKVNAVECHPYEQPNAFTPNGDGINDLFIPNVPSDCSDYSLMVYNRGGVKVFESKTKERGWDGKFNNEEQKEGAYFYVLQYRPSTSKNSNIKTIRGTIVLLPRQ